MEATLIGPHIIKGVSEGLGVTVEVTIWLTSVRVGVISWGMSRLPRSSQR